MLRCYGRRICADVSRGLPDFFRLCGAFMSLLAGLIDDGEHVSAVVFVIPVDEQVCDGTTEVEYVDRIADDPPPITALACSP